MANPLDQLYKTKLQLIAVLAVVGGIACLMLAHWVNTAAAVPTWLAALPISEIGSTLFGTGLLAVFFEYVDRKHGEERADRRIREAVRKEAPAIRDVVLKSLAFEPSTLRNVASNDTLDRIATNAIALRVGDEALAADVYRDLRDQVIHSPERWHDVDIDVSLSPWAAGPASGRGSMFVATVRWEYKVMPAQAIIRFACVADRLEYRELLRDQSMASAWYFGQNSAIDSASPEAFELVQLSVDGRDRKIRRSQRRGAQFYTVDLGDAATTGDIVTIAYTYRVLVQRLGHLLYLDMPRPTKGVHVRLSCGNAGIRRVNTLDYFASSQVSRVEQASTAVPAETVDVGFDGWVFPRSGVAFVWTLESEYADDEREHP